MIYVAGIDGGGTKTRCVIVDETGQILADVFQGPSNHQMIGAEETKNVLKKLYTAALHQADLQARDIQKVYLGLAGADVESDFVLLGQLCQEALLGSPFELANDTWLIQRSGTVTSWGAVVICGTGANAAAVTPEGERCILRSLGYHLGGASGGMEIAQNALHWAFRSEEGTGVKTTLEDHLPKVLGVDTMMDLLHRLYPEMTLSQEALSRITPLVFQLASEGDTVCQDILIAVGEELGTMLGGLLNKLNMQTVAVPVVLGGSVLHGDNPLLRDQLLLTLHRVAPKAYFVLPRVEPVAGAVLLAWESLGIQVTQEQLGALEHRLKL